MGFVPALSVFPVSLYFENEFADGAGGNPMLLSEHLPGFFILSAENSPRG